MKLIVSPDAAADLNRLRAFLADKNPEKREYHKLLDRYKSRKPYHRLGLLEEMGVQLPRQAAKTGD